MNDTLINPLINTVLPSTQRAAEPPVDDAAEFKALDDLNPVAPQDEFRLDRQTLAEEAEARTEQTSADPFGEEEISGMVQSINDYLQSAQRELEFKIDDTSGQTLIKVLNQESGELIRQIPPEVMVSLATFLRDQGELNSLGIQEKS